MEFDPHTLHMIIHKIKQQMRCPQCGERMPVDFASVRMTGDDFVLLQLKCPLCDAYIVLHASLGGMKGVQIPKEERDRIFNASSSLCKKDEEVALLRRMLERAEGSFEQMFEEESDAGSRS